MVQESIVASSLRCVEESQRVGVEALFEVMAIFPEDTNVPTAVVATLAPLICTRAGMDPQPKLHLKARAWLAALLRASLVSKAEDGIRVQCAPGHSNLRA